jgi:hypothetical protein
MNPATRLHLILTSIRKASNNCRLLRNVIAEIFDIEDPNSPEVIRSYVCILNLASDVESPLKAIPNLNHELYCSGVEKVQELFATNSLSVGALTFREHLTPQLMHNLEFAFDKLDVIEHEEDLASEILSGMLEKIDALMNDLLDQEFDPDFRRLMVSNLSAIRLAVLNYQFFGAVGIRGAMAKTIGELVLNPSEFEQSEKKTSFVKRCIANFQAINQVFTFVRNGVEVVKSIDFGKLLHLGG